MTGLAGRLARSGKICVTLERSDYRPSMRERAARPINEDGGREKNLEIAVGGLALLLLGAALAADLRLVELGTFRLRGLPDPETLYQLTVADLPARFPQPVIDSAT